VETGDEVIDSGLEFLPSNYFRAVSFFLVAVLESFELAGDNSVSINGNSDGLVPEPYLPNPGKYVVNGIRWKRKVDNTLIVTATGFFVGEDVEDGLPFAGWNREKHESSHREKCTGVLKNVCLRELESAPDSPR